MYSPVMGTPQAAVIDNYGAKLERRLAGEREEIRRETCCNATSSTTYVTQSPPEVNQRPHHRRKRLTA
jgi:hypothetical protein